MFHVLEDSIGGKSNRNLRNPKIACKVLEIFENQVFFFILYSLYLIFKERGKRTRTAIKGQDGNNLATIHFHLQTGT
jgi:hypothetical protein